MSNLNLYAEVLIAEVLIDHDLEEVGRMEKTFTGRLPLVRSVLHSRRVDLEYKQRRVRAAKNYLEATTPELKR